MGSMVTLFLYLVVESAGKAERQRQTDERQTFDRTEREIEVKD